MKSKSREWYLSEIARMKQNVANAKVRMEDHAAWCPGGCPTCRANFSHLTNAQADLRRLALRFASTDRQWIREG